MISVICGIDATHAVVVWNDLFHGERVNRIPLIIRWRQQADHRDLQQWNYDRLELDGFCIIDPPSKVHPLDVLYSKDNGETWWDVNYAALKIELPVIHARLPEQGVPHVQDHITFVFPTDESPISLTTIERRPLSPSYEFTCAMNMSPVLAFFLKGESVWWYVKTQKEFEIISCTPARFHRVDGRNVLSSAFAPSLFVATTKEEEIVDL